MAKGSTNQIEPVESTLNQIETVSDVSIPLAVVYAMFGDFIDGAPQNATVKGGSNLVITVNKKESV